jgi:hypothetical protein
MHRPFSTMTRVHPGAHAELDWINVSAGRRCPICGGSAGCKMHAEGHFAACGHEPSDWPLTSGAWLHRLDAPATASSPSQDAVASPRVAVTAS